MPSYYENAVEHLVMNGSLHILVDSSIEFKLPSFRSSFYRYRETELGKLMIGERQFKSEFNTETNTFIFTLTEPKKLKLEFTTNEQT